MRWTILWRSMRHPRRSAAEGHWRMERTMHLLSHSVSRASSYPCQVEVWNRGKPEIGPERRETYSWISFINFIAQRAEGVAGFSWLWRFSTGQPPAALDCAERRTAEAWRDNPAGRLSVTRRG